MVVNFVVFEIWFLILIKVIGLMSWKVKGVLVVVSFVVVLYLFVVIDSWERLIVNRVVDKIIIFLVCVIMIKIFYLWV